MRAARPQDLRLRAGVAAAAIHRRRLRRVTFVGVTGSAGKTTTKELVAAALGSELRGRKTPGGGNGAAVAAKTVLRTTNRDRFCVVEVAAGPQADLPRVARLVRPQVAVVTNIGADHRKMYRTLDAVAAEKRLLVDAAGERGTAVLNADDPLVAAMAVGFAGRVVTFGCSDGAVLRARDVRCAWPEPLSFTLVCRGRSLRVATRLHGRHWLSSVLAALGVAIAMDVSLERAAEALAAVAPIPGRMDPISRAGVTFVCDDIKAPLWAMDCAFDFLAEAHAARKIAVLGTISDYSRSSTSVYPSVARRALAVAGAVVFVGPNARHALKLRPRSRLAPRLRHRSRGGRAPARRVA